MEWKTMISIISIVEAHNVQISFPVEFIMKGVMTVSFIIYYNNANLHARKYLKGENKTIE